MYGKNMVNEIYRIQTLMGINENKLTPIEIERLRRLSELRENIEFNAENQDPINFDSADDFAEFCINDAIGFYYNDHDSGDYYYPQFADDNEDTLRDFITEQMFTEYYDKLVKYWEEGVGR